MAWPENKHIQVFDERALKDNLIGFLKANQGDALVWANTGLGGSLPEIKLFNKSPRLTSIFPALTFLQSEHRSVFGDSILAIDLTLVVELAVAHGNQDVLTDQAAKYSMALESLLANVPETTFKQGSIIPITSTISEMETAFDIQGKIKNRFIQVSQTRVSWVVEAAVFNS